MQEEHAEFAAFIGIDWADQKHDVCLWVPGQMKRWNRAGGKVLKGLARRREAEAALYELRWY